MKILEDDPDEYKHKHKGILKLPSECKYIMTFKDMSKDELIRKMNDLEKGRDSVYGEKEKLKYEHEKEKHDLERRMTETRRKSDTELIMLKKALKEKQEQCENQLIKMKQVIYNRDLSNVLGMLYILGIFLTY